MVSCKPQGVDSIENPARPASSEKYRLKSGYGGGESSGSSSFFSRAVEKPKGAQQDIRRPGPGSGINYKYKKALSDFSGPSGRGRMTYTTPSNQGGRGGTDSSEDPTRRGKGAFHFGSIPPPPFTNKIYQSGVGWVSKDKAGASSLKHTGICGSEDSSLGTSKVQFSLS